MSAETEDSGGSRDEAHLMVGARPQLQLRAHPEMVVLAASRGEPHQAHRQVVIGVTSVVAQQARRPVHHREDEVEVPVVSEVRGGHPRRPLRGWEDRGHVLETAASGVAEHP